MKCLSIQIQPELDLNHKPEELIELSRSLGRFPEVDEITDDGKTIQLNYFSEQLPVLWQELQLGIFESSVVGQWAKKVSIVVCEGESGWDDFLLLHHFDPTEKLDEL